MTFVPTNVSTTPVIVQLTDVLGKIANGNSRTFADIIPAAHLGLKARHIHTNYTPQQRNKHILCLDI